MDVNKYKTYRENNKNCLYANTHKRMYLEFNLHFMFH